MNTNSSKHHEVMSAENHRNKPDVKKRKLEEVHETLLNTNENCRNSKSYGFVKCCKETSLEKFDDKNLQKFNDFTLSGKSFDFIL